MFLIYHKNQMAIKEKEAVSFQETVTKMSSIEPSKRDKAQSFAYHAAELDLKERIEVPY